VRVVGEPDVAAHELIAAADRVLQDLGHRWVVVEREPLWRRLEAGFAAAGWRWSTEPLMAHRRAPDRVAVPPGIEEIVFDDLVAAEDAFLALAPWGRDPLVREQFHERSRRTNALTGERIFAVLEDDRPVAWAKLRRLGDVVQIEDVAVLPAARGRGLGRGVVTAALQAALGQQPRLVFIVADDDGWPKELYARLGWDGVGRVRVFERLLSGA
jgi:GNAT superfamily N-acetyltransferase